MGDDESQIIEMLEQKCKSINIIDDKWITEWAHLIETYFLKETRHHIRLKAIALLSQIFSKYHVVCEDELMSKVVLPNLTAVDQDNDSVVRKPIVHLLSDIASACLSYKNCNAVLAIIRKILYKPFKQKCEEANGLVYIIGNIDIIDSRLAVSILNKLFRTKIHRLPIDPVVNMLDISVNYMNLTYKCPLQDPTPAEIPMIRRELFTLLLNLRCNKHGHLGVLPPDCNENEVTYSPFIICVKSLRPLPDQMSTTSLPNSPTQINFPPLATSHQNIFVPNSSIPNCPIVSRCISLDVMFAGLIECINQETDSDVLRLVLNGLPGLLANKPLVLTATDERINQLCLALSDLTTRPAKTCRLNSKLDVVKGGLKCLTSLLIYRKILDHRSIKTMLAAFEESLKISRHPIVPLFTTCLIELQDSSEMTKFLPVVLNRLSKFSPTPNQGISVLEFLSYLILFPKLYENFTEDEYKFIFAIALPYTNPFRFSDYITCLAFRVIALWYLNCRPSHRSTFIEFVKKSLQSNVIQPFKENPNLICTQTSSPVTQTPPITYSCPAALSLSDHRKRSSSLNTDSSVRCHRVVSNLTNPQISLLVNEELIETFADLLSRYSHGHCLAMAHKRQTVEFRLDPETSQTWLHGNSLITITTSSYGRGWAEIMIRRPTGNTCWVGRLHNCMEATVNHQMYLDSLNYGNDVISLFSSLITAEEGENVDLSSASSLSSSTTVLASTNTTSTTDSSPQPRMQLLHPTPLPKDKKFERALGNFDHITPYETHKVGVVYVGKGQEENRSAFLANKCGSTRYYEFLQNIGTCIILNDIDPKIYFIGGLDVNGDDGKYAYFWKDHVTQVIFHVATFMPARDSDPNCNNKNRHIGNDHVCIVYNESGKPFQLSTIKGTGQIMMACIVVEPLEEITNMVKVEVLPDLQSIVGEIETKVLSNRSAPLYARQLSIHLNLASKIFERRQCEGFYHKEPYVSNWVERLRCIKRIRQRLDEAKKAVGNSSMPRGGTLK